MSAPGYNPEILERYPQPLAAAYARAVRAREPAAHHGLLLALAEALLKYLAAATAGQQLQAATPDPAVVAALAPLERPSLGHWAALLRAVLDARRRQGAPDAACVFPELPTWYARPTADLPAGIALLRHLEGGAASTISGRQLLDLLVAYRNTVAHAGTPGAGDLHAVLPLLQAALEEALLRLPSLAAREVRYLEAVVVGPSGVRTLSLLPLMGRQPLLLPVSETAAPDTPLPEPRQLHLAALAAGPAVPLHPWLVFVPTCAVCRTPQVGLFNGATRKAAEYLCYGCGHTNPLPETEVTVGSYLARFGRLLSREPEPPRYATPTNLPTQLSSFIGRDQQLADVRRLLARTPLLTLTGPGGTGKTRLALHLAAEQLPLFPDGVYLVNLAPLREASLVVPTMAAVLGVREAGGEPLLVTLAAYLHDKQVLLVLDNCEQVLAAAPDVSEVLAGAPGLKVLATSRAALRISGEQEYPVPPLALPPPPPPPLPPEQLSQYEAVALFIARAQAVKPDFVVTGANAPAAAEICARLEGLPLAIELAAVRVKSLPVEAILGRLGQRLALLTGGRRDAPARQRTLRDTIAWSYDLLEAAEQRLFQRLAVFRGGRTLEAVATVCNADGDLGLDVLDGLSSLVDKSLLYTVAEAEEEPRYWMLETIHEYAWERLAGSGEAEALQRRHALYFMRLAEAAEPELIGADQEKWLGRLDDEHDNIRAALRWAKEARQQADDEGAREAEAEQASGVVAAGEIGLRTGGALWRFWDMRGYWSEGRAQVVGLLAVTTARVQPSRLSSRARALSAAGNLAYSQRDNQAARALHEKSLALRRQLGDERGIAGSLGNLGRVALEQGDYGAARALNEESLLLFRKLGDKWGRAAVLNNLGNLTQEQGDHQAARALLDESLALMRELGDHGSIAASLMNLGNVTQAQGDYQAARALLQESLVLFRELGDKWGIAAALNNLVQLGENKPSVCGGLPRPMALLKLRCFFHRAVLGNVTQAQGDYQAACSLYEESLALKRELEDRLGIAASLTGLSRLAARPGAGAGTGASGQGGAQRGARLLGAVDALLEAIDAVLGSDDRISYERSVAALHAQLGGQAFQRAWQEGRAMSMEQAIAYALEPAEPTGP